MNFIPSSKLDMRNSYSGLRNIYIVINVKANIILGQITTAPIEALLSRGGGYYLFWLILMDNFIFCRYNLPDDHSQILWPASRHNRWSIQRI